jgi:hypothetical protein
MAWCCAPTCSVRSPTGPLSGDPELRPLCQGPRLPGRLSERVAAHGGKASRRRRRLQQPLPEAGRSSIPEKWVPHDYACVRVDSRGCGCSPGFIDHFSPRETKDFTTASNGPACSHGRTARSGSTAFPITASTNGTSRALQPPHLAAMCIWEGAADWYRDMTHHGGILCDVLGKLVRHAGQDRAIRRRRARQAQPRPRRTGVRAGICRNRNSPKPQRFRQRYRSPIRSTTPITAPARRCGRRSRCRCCRPPIGAARAASARQFRRLCPRGVEAEMARSPRHRALDAFLHRLRARAAAALLRPLPARQGQRLGQAAAGAAAGPPHRKIRRARREGMAAQAHANGRGFISPRRRHR